MFQFSPDLFAFPFNFHNFAGIFCFIQQIIGQEIVKAVRPGDNVTLQCNVNMGAGTFTHWLQFCNNKPIVVIKPSISGARFQFKLSNEHSCYHLKIINITVADLCMYNSAKAEKAGVKYKYQFGEQFTRLTLEGKANSFNEVLITAHTSNLNSLQNRINKTGYHISHLVPMEQIRAL